jgi:16S rRNA processing protein RimM
MPARKPADSFAARRLSKLGVQAPAVVTPKLVFTKTPGPKDLVVLGRVRAPVGTKGQLRVASLFPGDVQESVLFEAQQLWAKGPKPADWLLLDVTLAQPVGKEARMGFAQIDSRDLAEQMLGFELGVSRAELPEPEDDEFYWEDLVGCAVTNRQGEALGLVERLETNGVHDWIVVGRHWIPYVDRYIDQVDLAAKTIAVDWQPDWTV